MAMRQYRKVKEIPQTLLDHVTVCKEEGLYSQALSLLTSSLTAGNGTARPANVPPTRFIALAATLVVHPSLTTRTTSKDKHAAADHALHYLIHFQRLIGAKNGRFHQAFYFERTEDLRASRAKSRRALDSEDQQVESLRCVFAEHESLWSRSEDFWHMLGWALNCSVVHKHRWERWKHLLSLILDSLEDEMNDILAQHAAGGEDTSADALDDVLLVQFLGTVGAGRNNKRRVMRAILANGSTKSMAEFAQIWENETAAPKIVTSTQKKRRKLDLERGHYGDYDVDSDDDLAPPAQRLTKKESISAMSTDDMVSPAPETLGDLDAIKIRQRFLAVLSQLCVERPAAFLSIEELFDLYSEMLRPLPVRTFQELVLGLDRYLGEDAQSSLYQMLLRPTIDASAAVYNKNELTQVDFETYFAPYAANSSSLSENVKVSLLVENTLRLLWKADMLTYTDELRVHVTRGITARNEKVYTEGRRRTDDSTYEEECLEASGTRMLMLLDILQRAQ